MHIDSASDDPAHRVWGNLGSLPACPHPGPRFRPNGNALLRQARKADASVQHPRRDQRQIWINGRRA